MAAAQSRAANDASDCSILRWPSRGVVPFDGSTRCRRFPAMHCRPSTRRLRPRGGSGCQRFPLAASERGDITRAARQRSRCVHDEQCANFEQHCREPAPRPRDAVANRRERLLRRLKKPATGCRGIRQKPPSTPVRRHRHGPGFHPTPSVVGAVCQNLAGPEIDVQLTLPAAVHRFGFPVGSFVVDAEHRAVARRFQPLDDLDG